MLRANPHTLTPQLCAGRLDEQAKEEASGQAQEAGLGAFFAAPLWEEAVASSR